MASTPASFHKMFTTFPSPKHRINPPVIRSQLFPDGEGKSSNIVDEHLGALRQRIEVLRMKEGLENSFRNGTSGWNYNKAAGYDDTYKKRVLLDQSVEVAVSVGSSFGLAFFGGSIFIFLYSLLVHAYIHT